MGFVMMNIVMVVMLMGVVVGRGGFAFSGGIFFSVHDHVKFSGGDAAAIYTRDFQVRSDA